MKIRLTAALSLALSALLLPAAQIPPPPPAELVSLRQMGDRFMSLWCAPHTNGPLADLVRSNWFKPEESEHVARQTDSRHQSADTSDRQTGPRSADRFEFLGSKQLGNSNVKLVYLEKYDRKIVPWFLGFYKPKAAWKLDGIATGEMVLDDVYAMGNNASTNAESPTAIARTFMTQLTDGHETEAFNGLVMKYWIRPDEAASAADRISSSYRSKRPLTELNIGKRLPGAFELLSNQWLGKDLFKLLYVQKHEYGALPLNLIFYRVHNEWKLYQLGIGDSVTKEELSSAAIVRLAN